MSAISLGERLLGEVKEERLDEVGNHLYGSYEYIFPH